MRKHVVAFWSGAAALGLLFGTGGLTLREGALAEAGTTGAATESTAPPETKEGKAADLVAALTGSGKFTTFLAAAKTAGIEDTLKEHKHYTLFAPTDDAFKAVPKATLDALMKDPDKLKTVLLSHLVVHKPETNISLVAIARFEDAMKTAGGVKVRVREDEKTKTYTISGATITKTFLAADNGRVYPIDKVLLPEEK